MFYNEKFQPLNQLSVPPPCCMADNEGTKICSRYCNTADIVIQTVINPTK